MNGLAEIQAAFQAYVLADSPVHMPAHGTENMPANLPANAPAWAGLALDRRPSVRLLPLRRNAVALWQALDAEQAPPGAAPCDEDTAWLVWRCGEQPHFRSLDAGEAGALSALAGGATFGAVCARVEADGGEGAMAALAGYLRQWLVQGVLVRRRQGGARAAILSA